MQAESLVCEKFCCVFLTFPRPMPNTFLDYSLPRIVLVCFIVNCTFVLPLNTSTFLGLRILHIVTS